MPIFDTPEPISVNVDVPVGDVWIKASGRSDTVVEVRPSNAASKSDTSVADGTRVEYAHGRPLVKAPKSWRRYSFFGPGPSVDVVIELPSGSNVHAEAEWTAIRCEGRLGQCHVNGSGGIRLGQTGPLDIETGYGDVSVERTVGRARITTGHGNVSIREIDGTAEIKNSSGTCWVGEATGDVRVSTASGDVSVDRALAAVTARTAYGSLRVGEIVRGSADLQTSYGDIEVGVREGTAAWLDVHSLHGRVHTALDATSQPAQADETVEVRALTSYGDITIRRS